MIRCFWITNNVFAHASALLALQLVLTQSTTASIDAKFRPQGMRKTSES